MWFELCVAPPAGAVVFCRHSLTRIANFRGGRAGIEVATDESGYAGVRSRPVEQVVHGLLARRLTARVACPVGLQMNRPDVDIRAIWQLQLDLQRRAAPSEIVVV